MTPWLRQSHPLFQGEKGSILLHLVVILVIAGVIGTAMVSLMSTSVTQQVYTGTALQAQLLAESGYRYLTSRYKAASGEISKNNMLESQHAQTFTLDGNDGRFSLDIQPFFYSARSDHSSGVTVLQCGFPGRKPDEVSLASSGTLGIFKGSRFNLYTYTARSGNDSAFDFSGIINAVTGAAGLSSDVDSGATVQPVLSCETVVLSSGVGNSLTVYGSNNFMAREDGVFAIINSQGEFKDATGTKTGIYMYGSRTGTTLYDISVFNDSSQSFSLNLDADSRIVIHRSARIESTGTVHAGETDETNRTFTVMAGLGETLVTISASDLIYDNPDNVLSDLIDGATVVGDADTVSNGKIGDAMVFDGDMDYVRLDDDSSLDLTTAGSIGAWIKPSSFSNNFAGIIRKGGSADDSDLSYVLRFLSNERIRLEVYSSSSSYFVDSSTRLTAGMWYHVAGTWGPAGMYIFIDGQEDSYNSATPVARVTEGTVQIGAQLDEAFNPSQGVFGFHGIMDEVFIYNTQENLCEIRDIFSNPCNTGCDAVAYYPFSGTYEDGSGEDKLGDDAVNASNSGSSWTTDRFGCAQEAVHLQYSDRVSLGSESHFDFTGAFTVAAWVHVGSWSWIVGQESFVTKGNNSFRLERYNSTNSANFRTSGLNRVDTHGNDNLNDGDWHHVAGVYTGTQKIIYVDGVRDASDNVNGSLDQNNTQVTLGTLAFFSFFSFDIDTVGFWDRALDQDEIQNISNGLRTDRSLP